MTDSRTGPTIGVFDSGFGGLTVLRALFPLIPHAHYIYLGDTARLPYGSKSQETIARYAVESARFLAARGADLLVIACNTASALALEDIRCAVPIPVLGVIQPGAQAAQAAISSSSSSAVSSRPEHRASAMRSGETPVFPPAPPQNPTSAHTSEVLVLATAATVASHAYRDACAALGLRATEKACPLLVPLVEEGWIDHAVTRDVLHIYLLEALATCRPDAVLLGCTHYPLLSGVIRETLHQLHNDAPIIDSAAATAAAVARQLGLPPTPPAPSTWTAEYHATDSVEKFQRLGSAFLGQPLTHVHHLDLGG